MKKKYILILLLILTLTGCKKYDDEYYQKVANTIISFFRTSNYNSDEFYEEDREAIKEYWTKITHQGQIIDITEYLNKDEPVEEVNSSIVFVENNKCYIRYEDLKKEFDLIEQNEDEVETSLDGVCQGYEFTIFESDLYPPYEKTVNEPVYDYVLLKDYKKKNEYNFYYRSTYDGSGLRLTLKLKKKHIINIETEVVNVDGLIQGEK